MQDGALASHRDLQGISRATGKDAEHGSNSGVLKTRKSKKGMTIMSNLECLYRSLGLNVGILSRESRVVSEEEGSNNDTMAEGEEGRDEVIWMDGKDDPPDDLRYNGEGKKNHYMNQEHVEDSF